jgi:hypothetical protein
MTQDNKRDYAQRPSAQNEKAGYMSQLEAWINEQVIDPLYQAVGDGDKDAVLPTVEAVTKAIKAKMLESYRNGQGSPAVKEAYPGPKKLSNRSAFYRQKGAKTYGR